jgi:hypothetical protein
MSALYSVLIEHVHADEVTFRVTTIHPDAGPPPETATFPMNLLIDLWSLLERGFVSQIEGCTWSAEQAQTLARDPLHAPRMAELRALAFGRNVPCSRADIDEVERQMNDGEPTRLRGLDVLGWGSMGDHHHVFVPGDPVEFQARIAPLVEDFVVYEHENTATYADWPDDNAMDRLPRARVHLELADPTLLAFVRPGWRFESASHY